MPASGDYIYVADIAVANLGTFETATTSQVGTVLSTPFSTPHNLSVNASGNKLFVTHSGGTADQLSIYDLNPTPTFSTSLTVGTNPFGLVYYQY